MAIGTATITVDVRNLDETKDLVRGLLAERDQARSLAAKLEAELAVKDALLQRVLSHYQEFYFSNGFDEIAADITAALEVEASHG